MKEVVRLLTIILMAVCFCCPSANAEYLSKIDNTTIRMDEGVTDIPTGKIFEASRSFTDKGFAVHIYITKRSFPSFDAWKDFIHFKEVEGGIRDAKQINLFKADVISIALTTDGKYPWMATGDKFKKTALRDPQRKDDRTALMAKAARIAESGKYSEALVAAVKGAHSLMVRGPYISLGFLAGVALIAFFTLGYFIFVRPRRLLNLAMANSRANIRSYRERANFVLISFQELFQYNVKSVWLVCGGAGSLRNDRFQPIHQAVVAALRECFSVYYKLPSEAELDEYGLEDLQATEKGLVELLVQLLGAKALTWDLDTLEKSLDFMQGLDQNLLEATLIAKIQESVPRLERWSKIDPSKYGIDMDRIGIFDLICELKALVRQCQNDQRQVKDDIERLAVGIATVTDPQPVIPGLDLEQWRTKLVEKVSEIRGLIAEGHWSEARAEIDMVFGHIAGLDDFATAVYYLDSDHGTVLDGLANYQKRGFRVAGIKEMTVPTDQNGRMIFTVINEAVYRIDLVAAKKVLESIRQQSESAFNLATERVRLHEQNAAMLEELQQLHTEVVMQGEAAAAALEPFTDLPGSNFTDIMLAFRHSETLFLREEDRPTQFFAQRIEGLLQKNSLEGEQNFVVLEGAIAAVTEELREHQVSFQDIISRAAMLAEIQEKFPGKVQEIDVSAKMISNEIQKRQSPEVDQSFEEIMRLDALAKSSFQQKEYFVAGEALEEVFVALNKVAQLIRAQNEQIELLLEAVKSLKCEIEQEITDLDRRYAAAVAAEATWHSGPLVAEFAQKRTLPPMPLELDKLSFEKCKNVLEGYKAELELRMDFLDNVFDEALEQDKERLGDLRAQLLGKLASAERQRNWAAGQVGSPRARNFGDHNLGGFDEIFVDDLETIATVTAIIAMTEKVDAAEAHFASVGQAAELAINEVLAEEEREAELQPQEEDSNWGGAEEDSNLGGGNEDSGLGGGSEDLGCDVGE